MSFVEEAGEGGATDPHALPEALRLALEQPEGVQERVDRLLGWMASHGPHPEVLRRLALLALAAGQAEQAEGMCRSALDLAPDHAAARLTLGEALRRQGDGAGALRQFALAVRGDPAGREGRLALAEALFQGERPREALAHLEAIPGGWIEDPRGCLLLARIYGALGRDALCSVYMQWMVHHQTGMSRPLPDHRDLFFVDRELARREAERGGRFDYTAGISLLRLCYHPGPPFADAPASLIAVDEGELGGGRGRFFTVPVGGVPSGWFSTRSSRTRRPGPWSGRGSSTMPGSGGGGRRKRPRRCVGLRPRS
ncbi:MAG: tetratricopeptide repeat protein, partial [Magnetococcales bacterium]|nr:tetratricopeptide repeat protein [Magnetococcales bacterium]